MIVIRRLLDALDLHVAGIALPPLVLSSILPFAWLPALVAILPLGRLFTRAADLRRAGRSPAAHLMVNALVIGMCTVLAMLLSPDRGS